MTARKALLMQRGTHNSGASS